jgi:hypothetical protein
MDELAINHVDKRGRTELILAATHGHVSIANTLLSDHRTWWDTIVTLTASNSGWRNSAEMKKVNFQIGSVIGAELTRRQQLLCVIYPSTNPTLYPVTVGSGSGDDNSQIGAVDGDGGATDHVSCALLTSFFESAMFDVNVLRIIREYGIATYIVTL